MPEEKNQFPSGEGKYVCTEVNAAQRKVLLESGWAPPPGNDGERGRRRGKGGAGRELFLVSLVDASDGSPEDKGLLVAEVDFVYRRCSFLVSCSETCRVLVSLVNSDIPIRADLALSSLPTIVVWILACLGVGGWVWAHRLSLRVRSQFPATVAVDAAFFAGRLMIATLAIWWLTLAMSRHLLLQTSWSLGVLAFIGALAVEIVLVLYRWEGRLVTPARRRLLLALRLGAIATVWFSLAQPVLAWLQKKKIPRHVAVLVDDSESMNLVDRQMTVTEKLDLAEIYHASAIQGRWPVAAVSREAADQSAALAVEATRWLSFAGTGEGEAVGWAKAKLEGTEGVLAAALRTLESAQKKIDPLRTQSDLLDAGGRAVLDDIVSRLNDRLPAALKSAGGRLQTVVGGSEAPREVGAAFEQCADLWKEVRTALDTLAPQADEAFFTRKLDATGRQEVETKAFVPRSQTAAHVLTSVPAQGGKPLLDQLKENYDVRLIRFGSSAAETAHVPGSPRTQLQSLSAEEVQREAALTQEIRRRTHLNQAFEHVINTIPSESLAGVMLLSDGRHNGDVPIDDTARTLGLQGSPIKAIPMGSVKGPRDVAFLEVNAPESIFLGDKVRVRAEIKADGMKGEKIKVSLMKGGKAVATETVAVPEDNFRSSVRLVDAPKDKGIEAYSVSIEPMANELFANNNTWAFETSITDDRTNVLLIDSWPRWEFRYLRNLFYGRDKSVHLQYVILNPDEIKGQDPMKAVAASATRPFGEAEATRLPASEAEWMKFDVIILGDVPPAQLGGPLWQTLEKCVSERGAMLVAIAGPRAMPHAHANDVAKALLPVEFTTGTAPVFAGPEESFRLKLTAEGRESPLLAQSASALETAAIWNELPGFAWRHPGILKAKEGTDVLAYAESGSAARKGSAPASSTDQELAEFAQKRAMQAKNALLVTHRHGLGKVAMLNFDQTWRLRYGVGDKYHHRLWGNLLRWGAGEKLRAGTDRVRLGSDKLTYVPGEPITLLAKLTSDGFKPQVDASVTALVFDAQGAQVLKKKLTYREGSSGIYEATVAPDALSATGRYRVELTGGDVEDALKASAAGKVETHFTRAPETNPVELGDMALDLDTLRRAASLSSGAVVSMLDAASLASSFGPPSQNLELRRESTLWDNWVLLLLFLGLIVAEWLVRRRSGLV